MVPAIPVECRGFLAPAGGEISHHRVTGLVSQLTLLCAGRAKPGVGVDPGIEVRCTLKFRAGVHIDRPYGLGHRQCIEPGLHHLAWRPCPLAVSTPLGGLRRGSGARPSRPRDGAGLRARLGGLRVWRAPRRRRRRVGGGGARRRAGRGRGRGSATPRLAGERLKPASTGVPTAALNRPGGDSAAAPEPSHRRVAEPVAVGGGRRRGGRADARGGRAGRRGAAQVAEVAEPCTASSSRSPTARSQPVVRVGGERRRAGGRACRSGRGACGERPSARRRPAAQRCRPGRAGR